MASSMANRSLCKACNKAPGVFSCRGCEMDFCTGHAKEHRQELSKQLDTIILDHDQLKQNLGDFRETSNQHPLMQEINQWEMQSIDKIRKAANEARKELSAAVHGCRTKITDELKHLTQELTTARSEDNFIEIDLQEWMERLKKWTRDLNTPSSINIEQERNSTPFIQKIIICSGSNGIFERGTEKIKIYENGHVVADESGGHSTVRCHGEYSSGQYQFRFKIEQTDSKNWIYFGLVSKNVPLQDTSHTTATTFGWITNSFVVRNASAQPGYNGYQSDITENDTIKILLDCDRETIRLINERTNSTNELKVDLTQCPFPWQLCIGLYYRNDRVRYLPT